ncbi:MAG: benzoylformate decarboxylase [Mycolicibacterium sp.]|uniref:benzoylformate decarboxylase n=1 Tax=Mycolicibacterium sp. TaxID=2320850 RepID=UPI003D0FEE0D
MNNHTVAEATYDVWRRFGVDRVFGNPGSTEMRMFVRWPDDIGYVLGLQEATVVAMADGFAQKSGRPGVASVHTAAGLGNAMASVITAWRNQTPVVVIAGQQTRAMLPTEPYLASPQSILLPQPYVKWAVEPARAADVPAAMARALLAATAPPCGPTFVSVPEDDWDGVPAPVPTHTVAPALGADPDTIRRFAEILSAATAPAVVVGPQVDGDNAGPDAVVLAERLKAAVYSSPWSSRCSFPERHPLFKGFLTASREQIVRQLDGHDVILVVGAQLFTYHVHTEGPFLPTGAVALHMTDNPTHAFSAPVGESLLCSARLGLRALLSQLPTTDRAGPSPRGLPIPPPRADPISADAALHLLSELIPAGSVVVEEAPSYRTALRTYLPIAEPGGFFNGYSGGLGWGLPAAVGVALADPEHRTVAVIGDGSMMYSIQALWTAAKYRVPLTVLVLNNAQYGAMKQFKSLFEIPSFPPAIETSLDLPGIDLVGVAQGMGVTAMRVDSIARLPEALGSSLAAAGPVLLDIAVQPAYAAGPL